MKILRGESKVISRKYKPLVTDTSYDDGNVRLQIRWVRGMLLIRCENPCTSLPIPKTKEGFVSRKRASGVGMGIPIIKEIVDEAAGIIQMDQTDGHFIVLISLPADEENLIDAAPNPYAEFY